MSTADDEKLAWTDRLCDRDPGAAAVRARLLELERERALLGWAGDKAPPRLFQLHRRSTDHPASDDAPAVVLEWCGEFQEMLDRAMDKTDGQLDRSIQHLARGVETTARAIRAQNSQERNSKDLVTSGTPGFSIYGYGLCVVAWSVADDGSPLTKKLTRSRRLGQHPRATELRLIQFIGRDGLSWVIERIRGKTSTALAQLPESNVGYFGSVVNALSRIVNSVCHNPVPLWPLRPPPPPSPPRNPLFRRDPRDQHD